MRKWIFAAFAAVVFLPVAGCGGSGPTAPSIPDDPGEPTFEKSAIFADYAQDPRNLADGRGSVSVTLQEGPGGIGRQWAFLKKGPEVVDGHFNGRPHRHWTGWVSDAEKYRDGIAQADDGFGPGAIIVGLRLATGLRAGDGIGNVTCEIVFGNEHEINDDTVIVGPGGKFQREGATLRIWLPREGRYLVGKGAC